MQLVNLSNEKVVAKNIRPAYSFTKRLKGLMFSKNLEADSGLHIKPCPSVHTFFMNYAIDIIYLDKANQVVALDEALPPRKVGKRYKDAVSVIELNVGTIQQSQTEIGNKITFIN